MKTKWVFLLLAPLFAVLLAAAKYYHHIKIWRYEGAPIVFDIKPGESFASVNGRLAKQKIISSAKVFHRYSQVNGVMSKFKAGRYEIRPNSNMLDIIDIFVGGASITVQVTIPEGKNIFEVAQLLQKKNILSANEFVKLCKNSAFVKSLGLPGYRAEGYLYPETYRFTPDSSPRTVIKTMVDLFHKKTQHLDFSSNPLRLSKHQVIILASIVEKETGASFERPAIAGVFINRLKRKMRLQSDPTTIYGIFENFNGNLRKKHLLQETPYNTYKISGLPIGPIANPGQASIEAVLLPDSHDYLYFVSQNDGTHIFSKSYREHLRAVNKYQKDWRMRKGKSWRNFKERPQL